MSRSTEVDSGGSTALRSRRPLRPQRQSAIPGGLKVEVDVVVDYLVDREVDPHNPATERDVDQWPLFSGCGLYVRGRERAL